MSVGSSNSFTTTIPSGFIKIVTNNGCGRVMMSLFLFNGSTMVHVCSVARDTIGVATSLALDNDSWRVVFPGATSCADGGTGDQFDFTISKAAGVITFSNYTTRIMIDTTTCFKLTNVTQSKQHMY